MRITSEPVRSILRTWTSAVPTVAVLALGIGMITAQLAVLDATVWNALPFQHAERLVEVRGLSYDLLTQIRPGEVFEAAATSFSTRLAARMNDGQTRRLAVAAVSPAYFRVFGVTPVVGRLFSDSDATAQAGSDLLLSEGFWRDQFGRQAGVIGNTLTVSGHSMTVIGVVPSRTGVTLDPDFWIPAWSGTNAAVPFRVEMSSGVGFRGGIVAALKEGVSSTQAAERLQTLQKTYETARGLAPSKVSIRSLRSTLAGDTSAVLSLSAVSVVVLFAALAATAAALLLGRAVSGRKAIAVRLALGASPGQAVAPAVFEMAALWLMAAGLGAVLSMAILPLIARFIPPMLYSYFDQWRLLPLAAGVALVVLSVSSLPALLELRGIRAVATIREQMSTATIRHRRWQAVLGVWQVAAVTVVLTLAGLLFDTVWRLQAVESGTDLAATATEIALPDWKGQPALVSLVRSLPAALEEQGLAGAAVADFLPFGPTLSNQQAIACSKGTVTAAVRRASGQVSTAMGLVSTGATAPPTPSDGQVLVNATFQRACWSDDGRSLGSIAVDESHRQVVSVLADTRDRGPALPATATIYTAFDNAGTRRTPSVVYLILNGIASRQLDTARQIIRNVDPDISIGATNRLADLERATFAIEQTRATLAGTMAGSMVVIMLISLTAAVSYRLRSQAKQIAIRVALGASPRRIRRWVFHDLLLVTSIGVFVGGCAAFAATQSIRAVLFEASAAEPGHIAGAVLLSWSLPIVVCLIALRGELSRAPIVATLREP